MNKAFVREPDDEGGQCPRCGNLGIAVGLDTLSAMLLPEALGGLAKSAFFCDFPRCEVAYFDVFEQCVTVESLLRPVWPKDAAAPLCGCFGLSADDVAADVAEGSVARVKDVVLRSKSAEARCLTHSPTGQSCAAVVQRYYFRLREQGRS